MENRNNTTCRVSDIYLASFFWLHGLRPVEVDRRNRHSVIFHFPNEATLWRLTQEWENWAATVNLREWISAFRNVKSLAFDSGERESGDRREIRNAV